MKRICPLGVLFLFLLIAGCSPSPSPSPDGAESPAPVSPSAPVRMPGAEAMITLNGRAIQDDEINYIMATQVEQYIDNYGEIDWDKPIGDVPADRYFLDCALEQIVLTRVIEEKTAELGFALDEEELASIEESLLFDIECWGGREAFDTMLESMGSSEPIYRFYLYAANALEYKLMQGLFQPGGPYAPADTDIEALYETDFTNVSYILIQKTDREGNLLSGAALESQRSIADTLYQKVMAGEDFNDLIAEWGQDTVMEENLPGGYTVARGDNGDEFDAALDMLEEGGVSPVVEAYDCFYIIKKLPPDPGWLEDNRELAEAQYQIKTFDGLLDEWTGAAEVKVLDEYYGLDVKSYLPKG